MPIEKRESERTVRSTHQYLKEVEVHGYYGGASDLELVEYFVDNAVALEKLLVNPCDETIFRKYGKEAKKARERAKLQLVEKIPSRIHLTVL